MLKEDILMSTATDQGENVLLLQVLAMNVK